MGLSPETPLPSTAPGLVLKRWGIHAQDIARRLLEVLENYVTHPRARVDASERLARLIRVVKPISVKPVK